MSTVRLCYRGHPKEVTLSLDPDSEFASLQLGPGIVRPGFPEQVASEHTPGTWVEGTHRLASAPKGSS